MTGRRIAVVCAAAAAMAAAASASSPGTAPAPVTISESGAAVEIVRCHFDEGRIVVRHDDELLVLRESEGLDSAGLTVLDVGADSALLAVRRPSAAPHLRLIVVRFGPDGAIRLRELATDPGALTGAPSPDRASIGVRPAQPPDPGSDRN